MVATGGFVLETPPHKIDKYILLAVPHTSYWDGLLVVALAASMEVPVHWLVKKEAYTFPFKQTLSYFHAIPVDRSSPHNLVEKLAGEFRKRDKFVLAIPPEGTRAKRDYWKSGFYHIARAAEVPVVLGYIDYKTRRAGFGPALTLTGNIKADMDVIRAFYADKSGRYPERQSRIRLKEEETA